MYGISNSFTVGLVSQTGFAGIAVYDTIVITKLTYLPE